MDPYSILGVPRGCSRERVKKAFRTLVRRAHPDHGGDGEAFVRLCDAYRQILADADRDEDPPRERERERPEPLRNDPVVPREDYLAWMRQVAEESARRRDDRWWRRHRRKARAGLFGLGGLLVRAAAIALGTKSAAPLGRRSGRAGRPATIPGRQSPRATGPISRTGS